MTAVLLVIHVILAVSMVIVVLLQRSDGGALGGLGGGSFGGLMSGRQSANLLTRTTGVLAACFIGTSLVLAILATHKSAPSSILDDDAPTQVEEPPPPEPEEDPGPRVPVDE